MNLKKYIEYATPDDISNLIDDFITGSEKNAAAKEYLDDYGSDVYKMELLDEIISSPLEAVRRACRGGSSAGGNFDIENDYFTFDGNMDLISFNEDELYDMVDWKDWVLEQIWYGRLYRLESVCPDFMEELEGYVYDIEPAGRGGNDYE